MYIGGNTEKVWAQNLETNRIWDFFREKMAEVLIRILFEHTPPCYAWAPLHRNRGEVGWWVLSVDGEDFVNDVLAVSAPGEGGEVAFPSEFDVLSRAAHQTVGHGVVCHRELEFVAAQAIHIVIGGLETALNHLAFVGLEYYALPLEVVDVARIDAAAVDKEETEIDKQGEHQNQNEAHDGDNLCFA